MKILLIFIFSISSAWAESCLSQKIKFIGDLTFTEKDKIEVVFNELPQNWNVNSDHFENLYIEVPKGKILKKLKIQSYNLKYKKMIIDKEFQFAVVDKKDNFYKIRNLNFKKDILKNYKNLPVNLTMILEVAGMKPCEDLFKLEVIK